MKRSAGASDTFSLVLVIRSHVIKTNENAVNPPSEQRRQKRNTVLNTFLNTHTTEGECVTKFLTKEPMSADEENTNLVTQMDSPGDAAVARSKASVRARVVDKIRSELNI